MGQPLVDLQTIDFTQAVVSDDELRVYLPHAFEFRLLDRVCHFDRERSLAVGFKDWDENPWWARGHVPGRPLMPGVLMIEGAAQIATFLLKQQTGWGRDRMVGLAGLDDVRIRGQVVPPARVCFVAGNVVTSGRRLAKMDAQVFCNGQMTMEMRVMGVML
ncbi:MAG: 3-hydroxyacyl-ACP dehydratase FabZ family protein [Planctomycetota bacterium]